MTQADLDDAAVFDRERCANQAAAVDKFSVGQQEIRRRVASLPGARRNGLRRSGEHAAGGIRRRPGSRSLQQIPP